MIMIYNMTKYLYIFWITWCMVVTCNAQNHAFIQVDNELKYLVDGVTIHMSDMVKNGGASGVGDSNFLGLIGDSLQGGVSAEAADKVASNSNTDLNYIVFEPPQLDFKRHPVAMPLLRKVMVRNVGTHSTPPPAGESRDGGPMEGGDVHLHSLSGNTLHFHCTFFQDKMVSVNSNTTFEVVFLGREEGLIENTIFIHTSIGTYKYAVRAVGTPNPYRLRPLVGVRMPLNSSYTPTISLYNPHPHEIKVKEIYSSGGDLHLELVGGAVEGSSRQWSVLPYQTRPIVMANFVARRENNHTAYIRIVTSGTEGDYLVVPVEVEVSSEPGLYSPQDGLHFGLLTPQDKVTSLPVMLLNSAHKHINIQNVITTPVNEAISIEFKPLKIAPGTVKPTQIATVTFDPSKVKKAGPITGKLLIKSKVSAYKLTIPYSVNFQHGYINFQENITHFYTGSSIQDEGSNTSTEGSTEETVSLSDNSRTSRNIRLSNSFTSPVVVYNISLPPYDHKHFKVVWWGEVTLPAGGEDIVVAALESLNAGSHIRLKTELTVRTNITSIRIPITAYNGKLTKIIPPDFNTWSDSPLQQPLSFSHLSATESLRGDTQDFGTLGVKEERTFHFYVINENPVPIRLLQWYTNMSWCQIELVTVADRPVKHLSSLQDVWISPSEVSLFRLNMLTPYKEDLHYVSVSIHSNYELLPLTFKIRTAVGHLAMLPSPVIFDDAHPGKVSSETLWVHSTFSHSMKVRSLLPLAGSNGQFWYDGDSDGEPHTLNPDTLTYIGSLSFDPQLNCGASCYLGFSLGDKLGLQWAGVMSLGPQVVPTDLTLYKTLQQRFKNLSPKSYNTSLVLHTSHLHAFPFTAEVTLVWPSVVAPQILDFPLTQIQNSSVRTITLSNPSKNTPIIAQLMFLHQYSLSDTLPGDFPLPQSLADCPESLDSVPSFHFADLPSSSCGSRQCPEKAERKELEAERRELEAELTVRVPPTTLLYKLGPGQELQVNISFHPEGRGQHCDALMVRNNLTVIDTIFLRGMGGYGVLKFANRKSDSRGPLLFNIDQRHLQQCSSAASGSLNSLQISLTKNFTAKNIGDLPLTVKEFLIGGVPCQNYGFKIMQCSSFTLEANESRKIEVAFTPDFTLAKILQELTIKTDGQTLQYSLQASVNLALLSACSTALSRPWFEEIIKGMSFTIVMVCLIVAVTLANVDGRSIASKVRDQNLSGSFSFDRDKLLDLKALGRKRSSTPPIVTCKVTHELSNGYVNDGAKGRHAQSNGVAKRSLSTNNNLKKAEQPINKIKERSNKFSDYKSLFSFKTFWKVLRLFSFFTSNSDATPRQPRKKSGGKNKLMAVEAYDFHSSESESSKSDNKYNKNAKVDKKRESATNYRNKERSKKEDLNLSSSHHQEYVEEYESSTGDSASNSGESTTTEDKEDSSTKSESLSSHTETKSNNIRVEKNNGNSIAEKNSNINSNGKNNNSNNHKKINKTRSQPTMNSTNHSSENKTKPIKSEFPFPIPGNDFLYQVKGGKRGKTAVPYADITNDQNLELPYSPKTTKSMSLPVEKILKTSKRKSIAVRRESSSPITSGIKSVTAPKKNPPNTNAVAPNNIAPNYPSDTDSLRNQTPPPPPPPPPSTESEYSNRDSYSSKVTGMDSKTNQNAKVKITTNNKPNGKIATVAPQRPLGPIGEKKIDPPLNTAINGIMNSQQQQPTNLMNGYHSFSQHSWNPKTVGSPSYLPGQQPVQQWNDFGYNNGSSLSSMWPQVQNPYLVPDTTRNARPDWTPMGASSIWSNNNESNNVYPWLTGSSNTDSTTSGNQILPNNTVGSNSVSDGLGFDPFRPSGGSLLSAFSSPFEDSSIWSMTEEENKSRSDI